MTFESKTSYRGHGGTEIDSDATAPTGQTIESCEGRCNADDSCDCVSFRPADGKCWRRSACVPAEFGSDGNFNTYVKRGSMPKPFTSIRVAKGLGSRPYEQLRVSVISKEGGVPGGAWDYESRFQRCEQNDAKNFHLSTKLVSVTPGSEQQLQIGNDTVPIRVPPAGEGSVGLLVADPCIIGSKWCPYADRYAMKETLQSVINALAEHELDYWINVGDLFYDQSGGATSDFFGGLSLRAQGTIHHVLMGNHDYWQNGDPGSASHSDSFGNFHLQWYAQDTMSGKEDPSKPFDLSRDPSSYEVAAASNFQFYNLIGNVAFIGFTNQDSWEDQSLFFGEACAWVGEVKPALLVLLGHWNKVDMGCASGMDTPDAYKRIMQLQGCSSLGSRVKYFEGHRHCNAVVQENTGFLIGSFGMGGGGCFGFPEGDGAMGLPVLDTRGAKAKLYYFQMGVRGARTENFDAILNCLKASGLDGCTGIPGVFTWMEEELPQSVNSLVV